MLWALCLYLALELGVFVLVNQGLRRGTEELALPYLAFAAPGVIGLLLAWRLRKWEEQGASPRRIAAGWCLSVVLLFSTVALSFLYSGVKFRLFRPSDAKSFMVVALVGALIASFSLYRMALSRISARSKQQVVWQSNASKPQQD